jgi:predicted lipid-binding transport protein (Tim44 family)
LTNDLSAARRDLETINDQAARPKKVAEATAGGLQQERQKTASPDRNAGTPAKPSTAGPVSERLSTYGSTVDPQAAHLMARAKSLLSQGDINSARIVLQRVVDMGSASASFAIAETYDPHVLSRWNVYGTRGDLSKAREFYAKAADGGIEEAKARLTYLNQ